MMNVLTFLININGDLIYFYFFEMVDSENVIQDSVLYGKDGLTRFFSKLCMERERILLLICLIIEVSLH